MKEKFLPLAIALAAESVCTVQRAELSISCRRIFTFTTSHPLTHSQWKLYAPLINATLLRPPTSEPILPANAIPSLPFLSQLQYQPTSDATAKDARCANRGRGRCERNIARDQPCSE